MKDIPITYRRNENLVQEKIRANLNNDDDDPNLISKGYWSHVKATTNGNIIPETVCYKSKYRSNIIDQAQMFNEYFFDQFSEPSNYNIPINFSNESDNKCFISHQTIRKLLLKVNSNKAQGPDGIHGKILKNCAISIAKCFLSMSLGVMG